MSALASKEPGLNLSGATQRSVTSTGLHDLSCPWAKERALPRLGIVKSPLSPSNCSAAWHGSGAWASSGTRRGCSHAQHRSRDPANAESDHPMPASGPLRTWLCQGYSPGSLWSRYPPRSSYGGGSAFWFTQFRICLMTLGTPTLLQAAYFPPLLEPRGDRGARGAAPGQGGGWCLFPKRGGCCGSARRPAGIQKRPKGRSLPGMASRHPTPSHSRGASRAITVRAQMQTREEGIARTPRGKIDAARTRRRQAELLGHQPIKVKPNGRPFPDPHGTGRRSKPCRTNTRTEIYPHTPARCRLGEKRVRKGAALDKKYVYIIIFRRE